MSRRQTKSRATYVAGDAKKRRLRMLIKVCVVLLLPTLYFFIGNSDILNRKRKRMFTEHTLDK